MFSSRRNTPINSRATRKSSREAARRRRRTNSTESQRAERRIASAARLRAPRPTGSSSALGRLSSAGFAPRPALPAERGSNLRRVSGYRLVPSAMPRPGLYGLTFVA